jgi:hypothetical protein
MLHAGTFCAARVMTDSFRRVISDRYCVFESALGDLVATKSHRSHLLFPASSLDSGELFFGHSVTSSKVPLGQCSALSKVKTYELARGTDLL